VQNRDIIAMENYTCNNKSYIDYRMTLLPAVPLNDLEGHFRCLEPL